MVVTALSLSVFVGCGEVTAPAVDAGNDVVVDADTPDIDGDVVIPPECGDGNIDDGEECDDGNEVDTDGCLSTCKDASCGDGFTGPGELCDDGNSIDDDECTNSCTTTECGDGQMQAGEQCDDGDNDNSDACLNTCVLAKCGDGFINTGVEQCDDGNTIGDDGCDLQCRPQFFTGSNLPCIGAAKTTCDFFQADCRVDPLPGNLTGFMCFWPGDLTFCNKTPGIFTTPASGFAQNNSHMTFPPPGVCITRFDNLRCSAADRLTCQNNAADGCFEQLTPAGLPTGNSALCFWNVNETACAATNGIFTKKTDNFAINNPNALPPESNACITQVTNLQ